MRLDAYNFSTSTVSSEAETAFEAAVHGLAAHSPNTGVALQSTLSADPDHVAALALKGFANLILARSELATPAAEALAAARRAMAYRDGGTRDEQVLVHALAAAVDGSFATAAHRLDEGFAERPATFLPFKISHALRFMLGDAKGMLSSSNRVMEVWSEELPAAGFLLGCHAFALEEHGFYEAAEAAGQRAVRLQPDDAWGLHAVSHVHEMRGDTAAGITWLEEGRSSWSRCNNFAFHMAWHLALLHLERGDHEQVLKIYDEEVRPQQTDDFRDMANAVSLLWRLNQTGVDVGGRWADLAEIALKRRHDTTLVFASLHTLAALAALGEYTGVRDIISGLERKAAGHGDQAQVAAQVGLPLARIIAGMSTAADRQMLDQLVVDMPMIGGSNAQRDFFLLAVAKAAGTNGDSAGLSRIRAVRGRLRAEDRLLGSIEMHRAL
ncbi:tetratricopeptide repeat protein [Rhizobium sp. WL3]|uniref:tetratricopeptide repeat protein n=1 Tax=Rhizobium sp. WL3 TaxID=2603277 RepID=UPI0011C1D67D|nr:tetratricopeptide repeat protein [Rhizobium sp. WL3]QEE46648.1 tetratricopeptide repeat protein [Rhizobium sp. WL3]